jgi:hypothetical protein
MKLIAQEMQPLLDKLHEAERQLETLRQFEAKGGHHRVSIAVDHPDYSVRDAVERAAASYLPNTTLIKGLVTFAEKDLKRLQDEFIAAAVVHGLPSEPEPRP